MTPERERGRFAALVDALPDPEGVVITRLWWEGATMEAIAAELGWLLPSGPDDKKVRRCEGRALERLRKLAEIADIDVATAMSHEGDVL